MKIRSFDIHKAAGIIIVERKILVTREKGESIFVSPGGTVKNGESPKETVIRELKEEVGISVRSLNLKEFGVYYAEASNDIGKFLKMEVFNVVSWEGEPAPSAGEEIIEEILWLDSKIPSGIKVGSIFAHEVIPRLKEYNLID